MHFPFLTPPPPFRLDSYFYIGLYDNRGGPEHQRPREQLHHSHSEEGKEAANSLQHMKEVTYYLNRLLKFTNQPLSPITRHQRQPEPSQ